MALNAETTERNKSRYRGLVPFPKGKSGNPGGRTKQFAQCQRLCREASPDAARRLIELIQSEDERVALTAADKVFERAWGRPKEYDPNAEAPKKVPPFDPSLYTTEELWFWSSGVPERVRRWRLGPREPWKLANVDRVNEGHGHAEGLPN